KTFVSGNGNTDIIIIVINDFVAIDITIDARERFQSFYASFYKETHKAKVNAMGFLERIFITLAHIHACGHVDFIECSEHRRFMLRLHQPLGDSLTQSAHLLATLGALASRHCWSWLGRYGWRSRGSLGSRLLLPIHKVHD